MNATLDAIAALVSLLPEEKVQALAARVRHGGDSKVAYSLVGAVGTPAAGVAVERLSIALRNAGVSADELALMLLAASRTYTKVTSAQSAELVWTGPKTPFVSTRRTEQALLQVIAAAEHSMFLTSFVAYDVSSIVKALNDASARGVEILMLLESSLDHGGSISFDAIRKMQELVPSAELYAWREREPPFEHGRVHAKVAVADRKICFITSANLTGHAMELNMEAGVLIQGGNIPESLHNHLGMLVETGVVRRA